MQKISTLPLVSILIRSTGRPELDAALDSVAKQTYDEIEVLVADVLGENKLLLPYEFRFPLRLIGHGVKLQRSHSANLLLAEASGQLALFLDDDDWLSPVHIGRLVETLIANPTAVLAYAGVSCVECENGNTIPSFDTCRELRLFDEPFNPTRLLVENYLPIHAVLFRTEVLAYNNPPSFDIDFELFEDWDFWLQFLPLGDFLHLPGISAYYRIHLDSGTGVRYQNSAEAEQALDRLIAKWRLRWTTEQIHDLFGYTRTIVPLQAELQKAIVSNPAPNLELQEKVAQFEQLIELRDLELAQQATQLEQLIAQHDLELTQQAAQLKQHIVRHELECQQMAEFKQQCRKYENSHSWRITRPFRAMRRISSTAASTLSFPPNLARMLLATLTHLYRQPLLQPLITRIPISWKHRIRNVLLRSGNDGIPSTGKQRDQIIRRGLGTTPKVSIIIPIYNHAEYIEQSIYSALNQSWKNCEVIVVNDASPDPRIEAILERLKDEPGLSIFNNATNGGICRTQNRALIASTGDIIAFLDCDDYLAEDAIALCLANWRADTVYLHSGRINVDESGKEINRINFLSLPRQDYFSENLRAMYATHLKLIRRDVFAKVGLFDPRFDSAQDYEMLMRIAFHYPSSSFSHVPDFVYYHRLHAGQTTENRRQEQAQMTSQIQDEARLRAAIRNGEYARFLSFIMLSYGKHSQTLKAIQGLKNTVKVPHEIILYDNGSTPETVEFIKAQIDGQFKDVKVIYGKRNLGPAQGRRIALEQAKGEWFIIFDNDEIPEPGWIEELILRAEVNDNVGAVCCRVAFPDQNLQFSGGKVNYLEDDTIDLGLYDRGLPYDDLQTCEYRVLDWSPIGATLFTQNIACYLHEGYPNVFEDAGVSFALRKEGKVLLNAPAALVWHEHITFQPKAEMHQKYINDRYNAALMLKSIASFYHENALIIYDEYIWRENRLNGIPRAELISRLEDLADTHVSF